MVVTPYFNCELYQRMSDYLHLLGWLSRRMMAIESGGQTGRVLPVLARSWLTKSVRALFVPEES